MARRADMATTHTARQVIPVVKPDYTVKVDALLAGHTSIDSSWAAADFLDLALAALDQGGVSAEMQERIAGLVKETT